MKAVEKYLFSNAARERVPDTPNSAAQSVKFGDRDFEAKRRIVTCLVQARECAIADVAKALDISIPTVTKLINELIDEGAVADLGKVETTGGRRPNLFGVVGDGLCLLGVEIRPNATELIISDLHGNIIRSKTLNIPAAKAPEAIADLVRRTNKDGIKTHTPANSANKNAAPASHSPFLTPNSIKAVGIAIPCRVNSATGHTFGMFDKEEKSFRTRMQELLGLPLVVESAVRAACAAERHAAIYVTKTPGEVADNMLYISLDNTVAAAAVIGGAPYTGHSGFAPDIVGGALIEDAASAGTLNRTSNDTGSGTDTSISEIDKLIAAARRDAPAAVAAIEAAAERAGRDIAQLAQAFNPELVVVGGALAAADDYLMLPLQATVHRHMSKILYRETRFCTAHVTCHAAALGAILKLNL